MGGERLKGEGGQKFQGIKTAKNKGEDNSPLYTLLSVYINSL